MQTLLRLATGRVSFGLLVAVPLLTACLDHQNPGVESPQMVTFSRTDLYPEGIAYDAARQRFLVSSFRQGAVGQVTDNGQYAPFIDDPRLITTTGLSVDSERNRLYVSVADPGAAIRSSATTQGKVAAVGVYNLASGEPVTYVDLGALLPNQPHFANDNTLDAAGNLYVTDSFSPTLYKIDASGRASVFLQNARFTPPAGGGFGLNGIVFHPAGFLLVAKYDEGLLFKVPLDQPSALTTVQLPGPIPGADGLRLLDRNTLIVVAGAPSAQSVTNAVITLRTEDNWSSARETARQPTGDVTPTTATVRSGQVYVLYSYIGRLLSGQQPPVANYQIKRISP